MIYHPNDTERALIERVRSLISERVKGLRWIVATPILAESLKSAEELAQLGAERVLSIGVTRGVGVPEAWHPAVEVLCLDEYMYGDMMDGIRAAERRLDQLPQHALELIERFDPTGEARALRTIFSTSDTLAGRAVFGARLPEWIAIENKLTVDALWDAAGIQRAPSRVTELTVGALRVAYDELNRGDGVVIAGDNRSGWHGGASRTRWATTIEHLHLIAESLGAECDQARVMPYLKGVPCSIHGWVAEHEQISIRPCEMLVYPSPDQVTHFEYAGAATRWEPPRIVGDQMRDAAERIGAHLRDCYNYRGSFTLDGVSAGESFYPTEINPRFGGALGRMTTSIPDLPLLLLHDIYVESVKTDHEESPKFAVIDLAQLRALLIRAVRRHPAVRGMRALKPLCTQEVTLRYLKVHDEWCQVQTCNELSHAKVSWGASPHGSLLMAHLEPSLSSPDEPTLSFVRGVLDQAQRDLGLA